MSFGVPDTPGMLMYETSSHRGTREYLGPPVELAATERLGELPSQSSVTLASSDIGIKDK